MTGNQVATSLLLALLEGVSSANALRRNGKPCAIRLPDDRNARTSLVEAHLHGASATLEFHADGRHPWRERVDAVVLAALCPGEDGSCRWLGFDLDGADHGDRGLADPVHATRTIAERADAAGLLSGLLVARSRRGLGRHLFLILPEPVALRDGVIGIAALVAAAFRIAASDVTDCDAPHAFRCVNGAVARPGDSGAVELIPRSTNRPPHGWALALPGAGAFAPHGGGVIIDPFDDRPIQLDRVPRCDPESWRRFIDESQSALSRRGAAAPPHITKRPAAAAVSPRRPVDRLDARTRAFIEGCASEGTRNMSAFAAAANLLGCGFDKREAERLILGGAAACDLPEREARAAFASAVNALTRKGDCA